MAKMTASASSPSAGSGWRQMVDGAEPWSARIAITSAGVAGRAAATSSARRAWRARLPADGGAPSAASSGSR